MKLPLVPLLFSLLVFTACESTEDILESIDHEVPDIQFLSDSIEVSIGDIFTVEALVEDESGIERMVFSYGNWRINEIVDLAEEPALDPYTFTTEVAVPEDALKEWEEEKYFNDASSIVVIQQYHALELTAWDTNRNERKAYMYVKVE